MSVLDSALESHLKPLAVACALHGNDAGHNIYPSVGRLAWELSTTTRTVQRQLEALRRRGILVAETPLTGGARRTVRYHLVVTALPPRSTWKQRQQRQGSKSKNHDVGVTPDADVSSANHDTYVARTPTPETETLTPVSRNPDTGVVRSVSDQLEERDLNKSTSADALDSTTPTHAALCVLADDMLLKARPTDRYPDHVEYLKTICHDRFGCYDTPAIHKALDAVLTVRRLRGPGKRGQGFTQVTAGASR